jgi:hypothetical protein
MWDNAMFGYSTPGAYFEWQDTAERELRPERVDIAGFVGLAERGPLHRPERIASWNQFTSVFGRHTPQGYLAYAVEGFFANGGNVCYVVRVADPTRARCAALDILFDDFGGTLLRLIATSPGVWAHRMTVTALLLGRRLALILRLPDGTQEAWPDLSLDAEEPGARGGRLILEERYVERMLQPPDEALRSPTEAPRPARTGSLLVRAQLLGIGASDPRIPTLTASAVPTTASPGGGDDGLLTLSPEHLSGVGAPAGQRWGLVALERIAEVSIVAMPDLMSRPLRPLPDPELRLPPCDVVDAQPVLIAPPHSDPRDEGREHPPGFSADQERTLQRELVAHCERLKNRVAVLDAPPALRNPQQTLGWRREFDSTYAAGYYPWLRVALQEPGARPGELLAVPPSGHIAGIYARVETQTGPHKPPANELIELARDLTVAVDERRHGYLNDKGVNVIRAVPGRGVRVLGERLLSSDPLWRYVNVRRLMLMIERAIDAQTQWLVFEPSNPALWRAVERVVRSFLDRLWQQGMLEGATAAAAYSVTCDATTNPPAESEAGRMITLIGVQPPWPAEFVVTRIGKTASGIEPL